MPSIFDKMARPSIPLARALGGSRSCWTLSRWTVCLTVLVVAAWSCRRSQSTPFFFVDHVDDAERVVATFGDETRRAVPVPVASSTTFALRLPREPALTFAIAASTLERANLLVPIHFVVRVDAGRGAEPVFEETVRRSRPNQWFPREVDLTPWADEAVQLSFEAERVGDPRPMAEQNVLPLWGTPVVVDRAATSSRPRIILISIDCLRADHLAAYGYAKHVSPNIDAFAQDAVVFEHPVAASSYTLPAHASMLTGLPPSLHGARVRRALSPSVSYVPERLREAGYRVNAVVSASFLSQTYGFERGFHTYRVMGGRGAGLVDEALRMLDESEGQEQFLFLHLYDLHAPYSPPREFIDRFAAPGTDVTELLQRMAERSLRGEEHEVEQLVALYDAELAYVDGEIGRFLDELRARGLYDTSVIIVTSDHGEAFHEHGAWQHGRATAIDAPGLYEEIVGIPLIVRWPDERVGISTAPVVSQMDVSATILDAAGLESSSPWVVGLRQYLDPSPVSRERKILSEVVTFDRDRGAGLQLALSDGNSKYIASFRAPTVRELYEARPAREELYDLRNDPKESSDLLSEAARVPGPFRAALRNYFAAVRENAPADGAAVHLRDGLLEELRALGYLEP